MNPEYITELVAIHRALDVIALCFFALIAGKFYVWMID